MIIDNGIRRLGYNYIAGIDEVGRGCLAGHVVAAAVIMPLDNTIEGIKDSKKLTSRQREKLNLKIRDIALAIGIGQVDQNIIDKINIKEATKLAMLKAVKNLKDKDGKGLQPDFLLVDAETLSINDIPQKSIINGDNISYNIACASILAKVYRDNLCLEWGKKYPGYLIEKNKGYGTREHIDAIKKLGPKEIHRMSFISKIIS